MVSGGIGVNESKRGGITNGKDYEYNTGGNNGGKSGGTAPRKPIGLGGGSTKIITNIKVIGGIGGRYDNRGYRCI